MNNKTVVVIATLDTKGEEAAFVKQQISALGGHALLLDIGLIGEPGAAPDIHRASVIQSGGSSLET